MKKLTKKLFIIAMIAAGAVLSKPAFAMEASNSSGTNQYSNVDLTKDKTYNRYINKINQLENNLSKTYNSLDFYGIAPNLPNNIYFKWINLNEKTNSLKKKLNKDYILNLKTALNNAHNCQNVNNSEYMKYKNKFFDLYDSLTKEYKSICQEKDTLLTAIAPFQPNILEDIQTLILSNKSDK